MQQALSSIQQYLSVALIGWAAGLNLYLAVALAGICGRMGLLPLPGELDVLKTPLIIGLAIVLYAIEFVADKVPYVDSVCDSVHTVIRPASAGVMGALAGTDLGPLAQTVLSIGAGTFALNMHAFKASSRLAINTSPEPFSNIAASVAEDSAVFAMFFFFIHHPWLALVAILLILVLAFLLLRLLWQFVAFVFKGIFRPKKPSEIRAKTQGTELPASPGRESI